MLNISLDIANTNPGVLPDNPYGFFRNDAVPLDHTGTPLIFDWAQDLYYSNYSILDAAGITPSQTLENVTNSDMLNAIQVIRNGNIDPSVISSNTVLSTDSLNRTLQIDLSSNDVSITLPLSTAWNLSDSIKIRIVSTDGAGANHLTVLGSGGELISNWPSHIFYFESSWLLVKKYSSGLLIDDYHDARSLLFRAYFAFGQTQPLLIGGSTIIFPSIDFNHGSLYSNITGEFSVPHRGQYLIKSNFFDADALPKAFARISIRSNSVVEIGAFEIFVENGIESSLLATSTIFSDSTKSIDVFSRNIDSILVYDSTSLPVFEASLLKRSI